MIFCESPGKISGEIVLEKIWGRESWLKRNFRKWNFVEGIGADR
jgi:hypothetical protein